MDDLLKLSAELSDTERLLQQTLARYVDEEVIPLMPQAFEDAIFPTQFVEQTAKLGLLGMTLPAEYGGAEASYVAYGLACQELERGDSGLRSFVSVQSSLCMYPIFTYGDDAIKKRFLPKMAAGELIGCFGLTEADGGSDPANMRTVAKKVDGGWCLNGSKMWITNASVADLAVVWANTDEGIRGFVVEKDFAGFTQQAIHQKMSLRASVTGELSFQDVFVPDANYLPGSDRGLSAPLGCLTQARYGIAWGAIGAAIACYDIAVDYVNQRQLFGKSVSSFQLIQADLAEMYSEILKSQCLNLQVGRLKDTGKADFNMVSLAKRNACRVALSVARTARQLLGGNGISLEYHVIRHMLNLESVSTYEGTDNIHSLILGRHITGVNAFF